MIINVFIASEVRKQLYTTLCINVNSKMVYLKVTHWSDDQCLLTVPCSNTASCGDSTFAVMAPKEWNNLHLMLRESNSVVTFKRNQTLAQSL